MCRIALCVGTVLLAACTGESPTEPITSALGGPQRMAVIVTLRDSVSDVPNAARRLSAAGHLGFVYTHALKGFAALLPAPAVDALRSNPRVTRVEPDGIASINTTQSPAPSWGLDRIDQRALPLSNSYTYTTTGAGVTFYGLDTGILSTQPDFAGRMLPGASFVKGKQSNGGSTEDCMGHGTHTAGTAGGTTYGVAKGLHLVPVRVLDCSGNGSWSWIIAGLDWVAAHRQLPAVANMSLGGPLTQSANDATAGLIAAGVVVTVSAGNSTADACRFSPASAPAALTVAASDKTDKIATFSNFGPCVDLFAPGVSILSDWIGAPPNHAVFLSGTSMSAPHVAGAAALYLEGHPNASPASVSHAILTAGTRGVIQGEPAGTPDVLLFTGDPATPQPSNVATCPRKKC